MCSPFTLNLLSAYRTDPHIHKHTCRWVTYPEAGCVNQRKKKPIIHALSSEHRMKGGGNAGKLMGRKG